MRQTATLTAATSLFATRVRSLSARVTVVAVLATSIGAAGFAIPAHAAGSVATSVVISDAQIVDAATSSVKTNAVVGGDTVTVTVAGWTSPGAITAHFPVSQGSGDVAASAFDSATNTFTVVVPTYVVDGSATPMTLTTENGSTGSVNFRLWNTHSESYVMPSGHLNVTLEDLKYILDQVKIGEAHSNRTANAAGVTSASTDTSVAASAGSDNSTATITYPFDTETKNRCLTDEDILAASSVTYGTTGLSHFYPWSNLESYGVREVDGSCNNITNVKAESASGTVFKRNYTASDTAGWGAGDTNFLRLAKQAVASKYAATKLNDTLSPAQQAYADPTKYIVDPTPRLISNLIADQTENNPAAVAAGTQAAATLYGDNTYATETAINATTGKVQKVVSIPNITADYNVSAGYDSWFTLFGQFFDHGLDLIPKGGTKVYIPLDQSDPVYQTDPNNPNYMTLTRAADPSNNGAGGASSGGDSINITTPYVDQSQTYSSHASANFFLREYNFSGTNGAPVATGKLVDGSDESYVALSDGTLMPASWVTGGSVDTTKTGTLTNATGGLDNTNHGLAQWRDMKAQARLLGIRLTDFDVNSIPVIATDQYGKFIPSATGFPMMLMSNGSKYLWVSGSPNDPISTGADKFTGSGHTAVYTGVDLGTTFGSGWNAVTSGHPFINDTMGIAVPFAGGPLQPDADTIMNSPMSMDMSGTTYDNEALDAHYIAGDGRVNENIGLSSIHSVFHSEHNTVASDIEDLLNNDPSVSAAFKAEWMNGSAFNGNRIYSAARWITEMEYQHMVYDEFIRRISPSLPIFVAYDPNINASITNEFASAVYRLGHSMLNETIARSNPGQYYNPADNQDVSLLTGFTNPAQARLVRPSVIVSATASGGTITYSLQAGETRPKNGEIVSIANMDDSAFNVLSGVVSGDPGTTFAISSYYPAGGSGTPLALDDDSSVYKSASGHSDSRPVSPTDATPIATVTINDPGGTSNYDFTPMESAAIIAQGMSSQRGNEIDEFVTNAVRNNLLGLPLDLGSLNITRGRDTELPTLNQFRAQHQSSLPAYTSWSEFITGLRYPESGANFIAAYGTHKTITGVGNTIGAVSGANAVVETGSDIAIGYTMTPSAGAALPVAGDYVSVSGLTDYNQDYAIVDNVSDNLDGSYTVTVRTIAAGNPFAPATFATKELASTYAWNLTHPSKISGAAGSVTGAGTMTLTPNQAERRDAANAILAKGMPVAITFETFIPQDGATDAQVAFDAANHYRIGQHVSVSAFSGVDSCWNSADAQVVDADASSFTVTRPDLNGLTCGSRASGAAHARDPLTSSKLGVAAFLSNGSSTGITPPADSVNFLKSTNKAGGVDWSATETGFNAIDLWIGGLAENPGKQPITPPMLGKTFQYVFEDQALRLQNGDRFYYLARTAGMNLGQEIPAQKFTDIVRRNTPSAKPGTPASSGRGILGMASPGFSVSDCAFNQSGATDFLDGNDSKCPDVTMSWENGFWTHSLKPLNLGNITGFGDPGTATGIAIAGGEGDDGIFGTNGNDLLSGGASGGDLIDGFGGNDRIIGGPGEDLIKGGAGNDAINTGESQLGDIADGNSGEDFIHSGNSTGATASMIGEAGNDFIQGSKAADIALLGSEGDDWVEGGADIDTVNGDSGLVAAQSLIAGGNDVVAGQAGNDLLVSGDGGDDIIQLGNGVDGTDGGFGYDWATYEWNTRFDNGATTRPSVYADLSGVTPNPLTMPADLYANLEGLSGSAGNDQLISGQGQNITIPTATGIVGVRGSQTVVINAAQPEIVPGMWATGTGIGAHAYVLAAVQNAVGANTTTTVTLSVENTAAVTGPIDFVLPAITNPDLITGLKSYLSKHRVAGGGGGNPRGGWNTNTNTWGGSVNYDNGSIIMGGDGNDTIQVLGGSNIVDGTHYLHTCILVQGGSYIDGADTTCNGGMGFSNMLLLAPAVDAGTIAASDMRIVRELLDTASAITHITATNSTITYTAPNSFAVGDKVTVTGTGYGHMRPLYDATNVAVTAATSTTFTIANTTTAPAIESDVTSGFAAMTDTVVFPGLQNTYTISKLTSLPTGARTGYRIVDPTGANDIYNVDMASFGALAAVPLSGAATTGGTTVPSAPVNVSAKNAGETAVTVSWAPPASNGLTSVRNYQARAWTSAGHLAGSCAVDPSHTSCDVTGLTAGDYTVDVVASSIIGDSLPSAGVAVTTASLAGAPSAPRDIHVRTNGTGQAFVSWTAPLGGDPVTSYTVNAFTAATGGTQRAQQCTTAGTSCAITTLPNSTVATAATTASYIVVTATNGSGSAASGTRLQILPSATATVAAPTSVTATVASATSVDVAWTAPPATGSTAVTLWTARAYTTAGGGGAGGGTPVATCTSSSAWNCVITGLTAGRQYYVSVIGTNNSGNGTSSARSAAQDFLHTANLATVAVGVSAPVSPTVDIPGDGNVKVDWLAPFINAGSVTDYAVNVMTPLGSIKIPARTTGTNLTKTFTASGDLTKLRRDGATQYMTEVTARSTAGNSSANPIVFLPPVSGTPDTPQNLAVTQTGMKGFSATWSAVPGTGWFGLGGNNIAKYTVSVYADATTTTALESVDCVVATPCAFTQPFNSFAYGTYYVGVSSTNDQSAVSLESDRVAVTLGGIVAPNAPTVTPLSASSVTVAWTLGTNSFATDVDGFKITAHPHGVDAADTSGDVTKTLSGAGDGALRTTTLTGLARLTNYDVTVQAHYADPSVSVNEYSNASGVGSGSTLGSATPVLSTATVMGAQWVNLAWTTDALTDTDDTTGLNGFKVTAHPTGGGSDIVITLTDKTLRSLTWKNSAGAAAGHELAKDTEYDFTVTATYGAGGDSSASAAIRRTTGVPVGAVPSDTPTGLAVTQDGMKSFTATWNALGGGANLGTGASSIQSYTVSVFAAASGGSALSTYVCLTATPCGFSHQFSQDYGSTYYVSVTATNDVGAVSVPSARVAVVLGGLVAPVMSAATPASASTVDLAWSLGADTYAAAIDSYEVTAHPATGSDVTATVTDPSATTYTVTGLSRLTSYTFTIKAHYTEAGISLSDASAASNSKTASSLGSDAPANLTPTVKGAGWVELGWDNGTLTDTGTLTGFIIRAHPTAVTGTGSDLTITVADATTIPGATPGSYVFTWKNSEGLALGHELARDTEYDFSVVAVYSTGGNSTATSVVTARTMGARAPSISSAVSTDPTKALVTWVPDSMSDLDTLTSFSLTVHNVADGVTTTGDLSFDVLSNPAAFGYNSAKSDPYTFEVTGLTRGADYTYVMVAHYGITGDSLPSPATTAKQQGSAAPTISSVVTTMRGATLTWTTDPSITDTTVATGLTGFRISDGTRTYDVVTADVDTATPGTFTMVWDATTGGALLPGTLYTFTVKGVYAGDPTYSPASTGSNGTTLTDVPTLTGVSGVASRVATVSWTMPDVSASAAISGFVVTAHPVGDPGTTNDVTETVGASPVDAGTPTAFAATFSSTLAPATNYSFTVAASYTSLSPSASSNAQTATTLAAAPILGAATAVGMRTATVNWTVLDNAPSALLDGFVITAHPVGVTGTASDVHKTVAAADALVSGTSYSTVWDPTFGTGTDLAPGTEYTFSAKATFTGRSDSPVSNTTSVTTITSAPTLASPTAPGMRSATLTWTMADYSATANIKGFKITAHPTTGSDSTYTVTNASAIATGTPGQYSLVWDATTGGNLLPSTSYTYSIVATFNHGYSDGDSSNTRTASTLAPAVPTSVNATTAGSYAVNLTWASPVNPDGVAATGYTITAHPVGATDSSRDLSVTQGASTSLNWTNATAVNGSPLRAQLMPSTAYTFSVVAHYDLSQRSASSTDAFATTDTLVPAAISSVTTLAAYAQTINWTPGTGSETGLLTGWIIRAHPQGASDATNDVVFTRNNASLASLAIDPTVTSDSGNHLMPATTYVYSVVAKYLDGDVAAASTTATQATAALVPVSFTSVNSTSAGQNQVNTTWSAMGDHGDTLLDHYVIRYYDAATAGTLLGSVNCAAPCTSRSYTVPNLSSGVAYWFSVAVAYGDGQEGPESARVSSVPKSVPAAVDPAPVVTVTGPTSARKLEVRWTPLTANAADVSPATGGLTVQDYVVRVYDAAAMSTPIYTCTVLATSDQLCTQPAGAVVDLHHTYVATVAARNARGEGTLSQQSAGATVEVGVEPLNPAWIPLGGVAGSTVGENAGSGRVRLEWNAPTYLGRDSADTQDAAAVSSYEIRVYDTATGGNLVDSFDLPGTQKYAMVTGLNDGTYYWVTIQATNDLGQQSAQSNVRDRIAPNSTNIPTAPRNVTVTGDANTVHVSWFPSAIIGGGSVKFVAEAWSALTGGTSYGQCVTVLTDPATSVLPTTCDILPAGVPLPLGPGTVAMYVTVTAVNTSGTSGAEVTGTPAPRVRADLATNGIGSAPVYAVAATSAVKLGTSVTVKVTSTVAVSKTVTFQILNSSSKVVGRGNLVMSSSKVASMRFKLSKKLKRGTYRVVAVVPTDSAFSMLLTTFRIK